jgi:tetratricopeptide (TPR) repeat protein
MSSLANLGNVYGSLGQYEKAIKYHQQALASVRKIQNREKETASLLANLGTAYYSLEQYQKAIDYNQQSLSLVIPCKENY